MDDLVAFLRARLDEDDRAALAVYRIDWNDPDGWAGLHPLVREHAHRHDPARVLREVEAKRKILTDHYIAQGTHGGLALKVCTRCSDYVDRGELFRPEIAPCPTLRILAQEYADHPEFRSDWKV